MPEIVIPNGPRYHLYAAGAAQTAFSYTFPILTQADLAVKRWRAGVVTLLVLDTDYAVSGAGTQPGGTVTLTAASLAGDLIAIYGDETGERITDFVGLTFTATDLNAELDRIAQALLDVRRTLGRRLGIDETDDGSISLTLPRAADRANKVLGFSSTGAPEARASTGTEIFTLAGVGPPLASHGIDGDLALDTDGDLWLKAAGVWGATSINLKGAVGPAGSIGTVPDGTIAAPGIAYAADPNTGYHRPAADTLAEVVGGAVKVQTTATGLEILTNSAFLTLPEHATAPATPAAGKVAVYGKASGRIFMKDAAGREYSLNDLDPGICDFRLSLTSGVPVMTSDVTGTTLYMTPFNGNRIALYNTTESVWDVLASAELSLALSGLTAGRNYDVFAYNNGGAAAFEILVWTNDTTRATAIVFQDGVPCRSGDLSRRLVGSFRALSTTQIEWKRGGTGAGGVAASLGIWHANPKVRVPVKGVIRDNTDSWTYAVTAWRAANNSATMRVNLLDGDGALQVEARFGAIGFPPAANYASCGVGLDSTTALAANATATLAGAPAVQHGGMAMFSGGVGLGWHYLQALEARLQGAGSITFYGDNSIVFFQNGLAYEVMV